MFYGLHRHEVLERPQYARLRIGQLQHESPRIRSTKGTLSRVPYGEPTWLTPAFKSPYYNDSHRRLQVAMRKFVAEILLPDALVKEESGKGPSDKVLRAMADQLVNHMRLGPGKHLHGLTLMGGVKGEKFDYFHEMIVTQEIVRMPTRGYNSGLNSGVFLGLPPIMNFAKEPLRSRLIDEVLTGKKVICLAITEAFAGSDVAGMRTRATRSADGKTWTINGTKKWITAGMYADYFLLACKTSDTEVSAFLVPRSEGLSTKPISTSYSPAAGTAYVTLDNVQVPAENMVGPEGRGLFIIFSNFNHERWYMCCGAAIAMRCIVEECLLWASQRMVFGKPLLAQPVIRQKLSAMIAKTEAAQAWVESITYQMCHMDHAAQAKNLAGPVAFLKMQLTHWNGEVTDEAVQIFGGRGLTRTGMGKYIEHYQRTRKFDAVLGGAEEVLGDLGVRQL